MTKLNRNLDGTDTITSEEQLSDESFDIGYLTELYFRLEPECNVTVTGLASFVRVEVTHTEELDKDSLDELIDLQRLILAKTVGFTMAVDMEDYIIPISKEDYYANVKKEIRLEN